MCISCEHTLCSHHWGASGMPLASVTWPSCRFFTSCASQRLVVVSSFSTWAKVLSLSWSGRHCRRASLALRRESHKSQLFVNSSYLCRGPQKAVTGKPFYIVKLTYTCENIIQRRSDFLAIEINSPI